MYSNYLFKFSASQHFTYIRTAVGLSTNVANIAGLRTVRSYRIQQMRTVAIDGPGVSRSVCMSDQRTMTISEDVLSSNGTQEAGSLPRSHFEVRRYLPLKPKRRE